MDNEPYRDLTHHEAADLLATMLGEFGNRAWRERTLPSGKRADVLMLKASGDLEIFEVKTVFLPSLISDAQRKYAHWCHRLWLVVPHLTIDMLEEDSPPMWWTPNAARVGIIGIYRDAFSVFRASTRQAMTPALYEAATAQLPKT